MAAAQHPPQIDWLQCIEAFEIASEPPRFRPVHGAVADVTGQTPRVYPLHMTSDVRNPILFRRIPTLGFGPLAGDSTQVGGHDEWVDLDDYIRAVQVAATIM